MTNWRRYANLTAADANANLEIVRQYAEHMTDKQIANTYDRICEYGNRGPEPTSDSVLRNLKAIAFHVGLQVVESMLCSVMSERKRKQAEEN